MRDLQKEADWDNEQCLEVAVDQESSIRADEDKLREWGKGQETGKEKVERWERIEDVLKVILKISY